MWTVTGSSLLLFASSLKSILSIFFRHDTYQALLLPFLISFCLTPNSCLTFLSVKFLFLRFKFLLLFGYYILGSLKNRFEIEICFYVLCLEGCSLWGKAEGEFGQGEKLGCKKLPKAFNILNRPLKLSLTQKREIRL